MEEWINVFANVGFPIGVAVYLLLRQESRIQKLTDAINELTLSMERKL